MNELMKIVLDLEATWVEPEVAELSEIVGMLEKRRSLVARMETWDTSGLTLSEKNILRERVQEIRTRDLQMMSRLMNDKENLQETLLNLGRGRRVAQSYRPGAGERKGFINQSA
jgi:hypothetical protein